MSLRRQSIPQLRVRDDRESSSHEFAPTGVLSREVVLGFIRSRRGRRRFTVLSAVLFGVSALLSWWMLVEESRSAARLLTAVATTVAAAIQITAVLRGKGQE